MIFLRSGCGGVGGGDGDGGGLKLESESESMALRLTSSAGTELRPRLRGDDSGLTDCRREGPARRPPRRGGGSSARRVEPRDGGALGGGEIELETDTEGVDGRLSMLKRGLWSASPCSLATHFLSLTVGAVVLGRSWSYRSSSSLPSRIRRRRSQSTPSAASLARPRSQSPVSDRERMPVTTDAHW